LSFVLDMGTQRISYFEVLHVTCCKSILFFLPCTACTAHF
jgi:hypothetical protein